MPWSPMQIQQQWEDSNGNPASGFVLKAYEPQTTMPISIAIDSSGGSPQATITLNAAGKYEVSGNEVLPFIDRDHKWALFPDAASATANTNPFAGFYDDVPFGGSVPYTSTATVIQKLDNLDVADYAELALLTTTELEDGDTVTITDALIYGPGNIRKVTAHGFSTTKGVIVTIDANTYWERSYSGALNPAWWDVVGDGFTILSAADCEACFNYAIANKGKVEFDAGEFLFDDTVDIGTVADITGGIKISGAATNSLGTRTVFLQVDINKPVFQDNSINTHFSTAVFTCWAGNGKTVAGDITATAQTVDSITFSSDAWIGQGEVIWIGANQVATDSTAYPNAIRFNCQGAWLGSSVSYNGDGTITINNVKGAAGTANGSITGVVGFAVDFISLAHTSDPANFTDANTGLIRRNVRENQYYRDLWFNQVTRCFSYDALGSGSGADAGVGNSGFLSGIVADQCMNVIYSAGDIFGLQMDNCQAFGIFRASFECVGDFSSNQVDLKSEFSQGLITCGGDSLGNIMTGSYNESPNNTLCNGAIDITGTSSDDTFDMTWGRANALVCTFTGNVSNLKLSGSVKSHSQSLNLGWVRFVGAFTESDITNINFANKFASGALIVDFPTPSVSVIGTKWGPDVIHRTNHDQVGWVDATLENSWTNTGGNQAPVGFFKDDKNTVHLRGSATGGTSAATIFTLPNTGGADTFRPPWAQRIGGINSAVFAEVGISTVGAVTNGTGTSWADFNSITFTTETNA